MCQLMLFGSTSRLFFLKSPHFKSVALFSITARKKRYFHERLEATDKFDFENTSMRRFISQNY